MGSHPIKKSEIALLVILTLAAAASAHAREAESEVAAAVPCALITVVSGEADVLDSTRSHLLPSQKRSGIPCGGWVSVGKGSVELHHRDGFKIHLGAGTFVQFPEPNPDGRSSGDQLVLFRGQIFAQAGGGSGEMRVITANSRARIKRGSAIVVYNHDDEETQLISLESSSSLENRFEPSRKVLAKAGEATSLNFKQLRVLPATPRAVALAALKPKFDELHVPARDRGKAVHSAQDRQERLFAAELVEGEPVETPKPIAKPAPVHTGSRRIASEEAPRVEPAIQSEVRARLQAHRQPDPKTYESHPDDAENAEIREHWVNRMVAGVSAGKDIIEPKEYHGKLRKGSVQVIDLDAQAARGKKKARKLTPEDEEKLRLIDELSQIREE